MFVLMDIEWVENSQHHISPTQIAAMRVDEQWQCIDRFYSRIAPRDSSFHCWKHVAYAGGSPSDFLYADGVHRVFSALQAWLEEDDVLCFWYKDSKNILKSVFQLIFQCAVSHRIVVLSEYVFAFLDSGAKIENAYRLCRRLGTQSPGPKHHAERDVDAMQAALAALQYPPELLHRSPPSLSETPPPTPHGVCEFFRPYRLDVAANIFHRKDCSAIPENAVLTAHPDLKYFFRKKPTPCPLCMKEDVRQGIRAQNADIIARTAYQFVYAKNSDVFHRRSCSAILRTTDTIHGSVYYSTCAATGRRPCKLCNPTPEARPHSPKKKKAKHASPSVSIPNRSLNAQEQRAFARYQEARRERYLSKKETFASQSEKDDFFTLTQPRFAFFRAAGYQAFHRRNCPKLHGLSGISGFARYADAIRAGHTPCKVCKPTAKLDIECSIPITNQKRKGESVNILASLCEEHGYAYESADHFFCLSTPTGKWKIDVHSAPYIVYHINLVRTPNNEHDYHRQPRLFLSLLDTFSYIHHHDKDLCSSPASAPPTATELTEV